VRPCLRLATGVTSNGMNKVYSERTPAILDSAQKRWPRLAQGSTGQATEVTAGALMKPPRHQRSYWVITCKSSLRGLTDPGPTVDGGRYRGTGCGRLINRDAPLEAGHDCVADPLDDGAGSFLDDLVQHLEVLPNQKIRVCLRLHPPGALDRSAISVNPLASAFRPDLRWRPKTS
jgi:hypothetical protein